MAGSPNEQFPLFSPHPFITNLLALFILLTAAILFFLELQLSLEFSSAIYIVSL